VSAVPRYFYVGVIATKPHVKEATPLLEIMCTTIQRKVGCVGLARLLIKRYTWPPGGKETSWKRVTKGGHQMSNDELTELLVWAYKQGFLDAAQVLTKSVKSLDDAKIRAQLSAGLEELSKPAAPDKPEAEGSE
jgi:hypothetical protein